MAVPHIQGLLSPDGTPNVWRMDRLDPRKPIRQATPNVCCFATVIEPEEKGLALKLGFREIAAAIRTDIVGGTYPTASVLPPEPELVKRYGRGASRSIVNRSLSLLAAEGMVRPKQGRGTIVTWLPPMVHSADRYSRSTREQNNAKGAFDSEVLALGLEPRHEITVERMPAPADIAAALGISEGALCLVRSRRLLASGIPVRLNASWFPLDIADGTVLEADGPVIKGGVKSALAELGYQETSASERIIPSRLPSGDEADRLEISVERSVTEIFHVAKTAEGRAVEVTTTVAPAHYITIETSFALA
jgi:GntR family transcriptional regulator